MDNNNQLKENIHDVKDDVTRIRSDFSNITEKLIDISRSAYSTKNRELQAEARKLYDELAETLETSRLLGKGGIEEVERKIVERPFLSVLLAFLMGMLIGELHEKR